MSTDRTHRRFAAAYLLLVTIVLGACSAGATPAATSPPSPVPTAVTTTLPTFVATEETHTVTGQFLLGYADKMDLSAGGCSGTGGYDDIRDGTGVVVRDEIGTTVATGELVFAEFQGEQAQGLAFGRCLFRFTVLGIPRASFYSFEVSHRGALTYSYPELVAMDWAVSFELGTSPD